MSVVLYDTEGKAHHVMTEFLEEPEYRAMLRDRGVVLPEGPESGSDDSGSTPRASGSEVIPGVMQTKGGTVLHMTRDALERHVQKSRVQGDDVVDVTTGRPALYVPPHARGTTATSLLRAVDKAEAQAKRAKAPKTLLLSGVMRDAGLQQKYGISEEDLALIGIISSSSLEMAAVKATEIVRRAHPYTTVICDMSDASKARVRAGIKSVYHKRVVTTHHREIPMTYYPGTGIVSMLPDEGAVREDSAYTWELTCPVNEWVTAGMVWELVNAEGPYTAAETVGNDYSLLRILVTLIDRQTGEAHVLHPGEQPHAGVFDDALELLGLSEGTVAAEVAGMDVGAVSVVVDDERVGTVLKVDEEWAVTTGHVLKTPDAEVAGQSPFVSGNVKRLSSTLMAVQMDPSVATCNVDVVTRPPVVGELVHVRMVRTDEGGATRVTTSASVRVAEVTDFCFVPGLPAYPGMSGCAYVADADNAVVAVHEGTKAQVSVGVAMIHNVRSACTARESWYSGRMPGLGCVQSPTVKAWADTNSSAYAAWVKLAGSMVVGYGGSVEYHPRRAVITGSQPSSPTELTTRPPVLHERCVIVAIDASGVYMSHELSYGGLVSMCAPASDLRWWALMRKGSVVVAVEDAAIIASVWHATEPVDDAAERWVLTPESLDTRASRLVSPGPEKASRFMQRRESGPYVADNRRWLQRTFPFLNSHVYSGEDIDECFTHKSYSQYQLSGNPFVGNCLLAKVGRTVMTARLLLKLRGREDALDTVDEFAAKWQTAHVKTIVAEQFQMLGQLRVSPSYKMDIMVDSTLVVDAMVGLVYLHEADTMLDKFIGSIAMFGDL